MSTSGKLLINVAISLLGVYIFFIVGGHIRPYGDAKEVDIACGFSSALLQYFTLAYFGWTAAEALNLYFSLVKLFEAKPINSYTLKAGLIVWRKKPQKTYVHQYSQCSSNAYSTLSWMWVWPIYM